MRTGTISINGLGQFPNEIKCRCVRCDCEFTGGYTAKYCRGCREIVAVSRRKRHYRDKEKGRQPSRRIAAPLETEGDGRGARFAELDRLIAKEDS